MYSLHGKHDAQNIFATHSQPANLLEGEAKIPISEWSKRALEKRSAEITKKNDEVLSLDGEKLIYLHTLSNKTTSIHIFFSRLEVVQPYLF